jgi:hypothetical protein
MGALTAAALYFAIVFGAGFVLGPIRLLWVVPRLGTRMAELMEMPVMLAVIIVAARAIVRRLADPATASRRLVVGGVALALLLSAELVLLFPLRGLSPGAYLAGLDPVSGTVYVAMLAAFGLMPLLVARADGRRVPSAIEPDRGEVPSHPTRGGNG